MIGVAPDDAAIPLRTCKSDAMKLASERDNGPFDEGDGLRQTFKLPSEPIGMPGQKGARILDTPPMGEGQYRGTLGVADL